jgi:hypothetical protein
LDAWSSPTLGVVATSTPWSLKPAAMRGSQFSSRWKWIVLGMECGELGLKRCETHLRLHLGHEPVVRRDVSVNLRSVAVIVGQCREDGG